MKIFRNFFRLLVCISLLATNIITFHYIITSSGYSNHPSGSHITIRSNSDFSTYFSGGPGDINHPWVLNGYNFTDKNFVLIDIQDTTQYFIITGNFLDNTNYGLDAIYLKNVVNGNISDNIIVNSRHGIYLDNSNDSLISDNTIDDTSESGIRLNNSNLNTISENDISNNGYHGIWLNSSNSNEIRNNIIYDNYNGIWLKSDSSDNNIYNNTIQDTYHAIWISSSGDNEIYFNSLLYNGYGIYITDYGYNNETEAELDPIISPEDNEFTNNTIYNSTYYGLCFDGNVINSSVKWNSFVGNNIGGTAQAFDNGTDNIYVNNFWDDWTGPDSEPDGIVDYPYNIDGPTGNSDLYPLAAPQNPVTIHFLSDPIIISPNGGEILKGTTAISWVAPFDSLEHSLTYFIYYSSDSGITWIELAVDVTDTTLDWDTTTVTDGSIYMIKVNATCSEGLTSEDTSDSPFSIKNSGSPPSTTTTTEPNIPTHTPDGGLGDIIGLIGLLGFLGLLIALITLLAFKRFKH